MWDMLFIIVLVFMVTFTIFGFVNMWRQISKTDREKENLNQRLKEQQNDF